ncbi:hypothetical protein F4776DRAFT_621149 [Hypoxylon sp. NC0597]|nr:hypothetical protein F4776DRAFT_621149 [Hypoxylon sp. NC0597]
MSTPDKLSRNDGEVIIVTLILRPNGPHVSPFPKRQFLLSCQTPSIRIGRASKVPTKGFVASIDNAWFDSPVMSRQHAELVLDCESTPKAVYIKDIGSLHGTFHTPYDGIRKESRLEQRKLVRLSNGDSLRFGTDIFRGSETFPPCFVDFYMIGQEQEPHNQPTPIAQQPTNRVFTIPDDDLDDDDDDDDDSVIETVMPPSRKVDIQRGPSIDLTHDETDDADDQMYCSKVSAQKNPNSDVIDLTSEPGEISDPEPAAVSRRHSSASLSTTVPALPAFVANFTAYQPVLSGSLDYAQKVTDFGSEPDRSSEHDLYLNQHSHQHDEETSSEDIRLTDSENDSIITRDSFDESSDSGDDLDEENESVTSSVSSGHHGRFNIWMDEDESLDDLPYSDDASSSSSEDSLISVPNSSSPAFESSPYSPPNPPVSKEETSDGAEVEASTGSADTKGSFVTPFLFTAAAQPDAEAAHPREPSPSDAAMFKSHPTLDRTSSDSRAQALGEKSGKYEFFAARESNRTALVNRPSLPISAIREALGENPDKPTSGAETDHPSPSAIPIVRVDDGHTEPMEEVLNTVNTVPKASTPVLMDFTPFNDPTWAPLPEPSCQTLSVSGEKFINNPRNEDLPYQNLERPRSPEFDMTSAYTFQLSKMATESSTNQKPRRVGIEDLLTREPQGIRLDIFGDEHPVTAAPAPFAPVPVAKHTSPGHCLKRSFEDAFSDSHAEPDAQPKLDDTHTDDTHTQVDKTKLESTSRQVQGGAITEEEDSRASAREASLARPRQDERNVEPVTISTRSDNVQPSKRRRFAQAAACVALGGAAAFTFMVSTAPVL